MSQTIIAVFIQLLTFILPSIGVTVGSDQLTQTIQTVVAIVTGIWIYARRVQAGDVTKLGVRK